MNGLIDIVSKNRNTFYSYRTKQPSAVWKRNVIIILVSIIFVIVVPSRFDNLYLAILTAQAILAGFSFNVMIFLSSVEPLKVAASSSIENGVRINKINLLSEEIFYNVAYFNLLSLFSVALCIIALFMFGMFDNIRTYVLATLIMIPDDPQWPLSVLFVLNGAVVSAILFLLYGIVIESFLTFFRTVMRCSYYFSERLGLKNVSPQ